MDIQTLKARIRSLVDDAQGTYTTDDWLLPMINQKYDELYNRLRLNGYSFDEAVVELPAVPAGTPDASSYQTSGQPLELLLSPTLVEWKLAGTPAVNYSPTPILDKVRDVVAAPLLDSCEWRNSILYFSAFSTAIDIRVRGEFLFSPLVKDVDILQAAKNIGVVMAYETASLIGIVRGNEQWKADYKQEADDAFDDLTMAMVRADQAKVRRVGRTTRRRAGMMRNPTN